MYSAEALTLQCTNARGVCEHEIISLKDSKCAVELRCDVLARIRRTSVNILGESSWEERKPRMLIRQGLDWKNKKSKQHLVSISYPGYYSVATKNEYRTFELSKQFPFSSLLFNFSFLLLLDSRRKLICKALPTPVLVPSRYNDVSPVSVHIQRF